MKIYYILACVISIVLGTACTLPLESSGNRRWTMSDMIKLAEQGTAEARVNELQAATGHRLPVRLDGGSNSAATCEATECFRLYYFVGKSFNRNDINRKNILFIPGGPGNITPREQGLASILEADYNVVYLDLRGIALSHFGNDPDVQNSDIQFDRNFDRFLRANYIIQDIDHIRRAALGSEAKWHAIYGHSYGTVIAQQYASSHASFVERLILSAPINRHKETDSARTDRVLRNLDNVYNLIVFENPAAECLRGGEDVFAELEKYIQQGMRPPEPKLKKIVPIKVALGSLIPTVLCNDDFSFLDSTRIQNIKAKLKDVYSQIEKHYGSVNFLTLNFDKVRKEKDFRNRFPYPEAFFVALTQVQRLGSPELEGNVYAEEIGHFVRVAMVLGYYSMFDLSKAEDRRDSSRMECTVNAPFLQNVTSLDDKKKLCDRIALAIRDTKSVSGIESRRALYVLGLYDGIFRWVFTLLDTKLETSASCPNGFIRAQHLAEFLAGTSRKMLRDEFLRVGISDPNEEICSWNPARFKHGVQTLILKGAADAITAGGQAEEFFYDGLRNRGRQGVLVEFGGMGHDPNVPIYPNVLQAIGTPGLTDFGNAYKVILKKFLSQTVEEFRQDLEVRENLVLLKAADVTPVE